MALEQEGDSYKTFRETIKKELIIQRVQRGKVGSRVDISEQELENFINSEEGRTELAEQYNVQHILISVKGGLTEVEIEAIEEKALEIIKRLDPNKYESIIKQIEREKREPNNQKIKER